jgi:macrodomain Ter protein organizer (MatP/YcbG family)
VPTVTIDLTLDLEQRLSAAAQRDGVTLPDYVHHVLEQAAPTTRQRVTHEQLRHAAEAAQEYYATDPEALELAEFAGDEPVE